MFYNNGSQTFFPFLAVLQLSPPFVPGIRELYDKKGNLPMVVITVREYRNAPAKLHLLLSSAPS